MKFKVVSMYKNSVEGVPKELITAKEGDIKVFTDPSTGNRYVRGAEIGKGGMSVVYKTSQPEGYAVKKMRTYPKPSDGGKAGQDGNTMENLKQEVYIQASLDHPNILKVIASAEYQVPRKVIVKNIEVQNPQKMYAVMPLVEGPDLFSYLVDYGPMSLKQCRALLAPIFEAVAYTHTMGIVHRDLKPENMLINASKDLLKIIDFGLATRLSDAAMQTVVGSPNYVAPEAARRAFGSTDGAALDEKIDVFSLGVVLYICAYRCFPYSGGMESDEQVLRTLADFSIKELKRQEHFVLEKDECFKFLLIGLLEPNPKKRLSAEDAFLHPFFQAEGVPNKRKNTSNLTESLYGEHDPYFCEEAGIGVGSKAKTKRTCAIL